MNIDFDQLLGNMFDAMKEVVGDNIEDVKKLADEDLKSFAERTASLAKKVADGSISLEEAKAVLKIRRNAIEGVLLAIAGIGILAAQEAINAALDVLKQAISTAIPGVNLID